METREEGDLRHGLTRECEELKRRLARAERRIRWGGVLLLMVVVVPVLLGAFTTSDQIVLRDEMTGNTRILMEAHPNTGAWIQINAADGSRRIFLGENTNGVPELVIFNPDQTIARRYGP